MEPVALEVEGERIHAEHHAPRGPAKGGIVLVHGFNSCIAEFGSMPARLAEAGFHAFAFDQRGFGASGGEPGLTSPARALADIEAARSWLAPRAGGPVGLMGHSLGGAYGVMALAKGGFAFGILAHPLDRMWEVMSPVERLGYHLAGRWNELRLRRGKPSAHVPYRVHYSQIFESEEAAIAAERPPFLLKRANLANFRMALEAKARDHAPRVTVPVLTVLSRKDRVIRWDQSHALHGRLGGPSSVLEHQGGHSCFRDLDGPKVADGILAWLGTTVRGLAEGGKRA